MPKSSYRVIRIIIVTFLLFWFIYWLLLAPINKNDVYDLQSVFIFLQKILFILTIWKITWLLEAPNISTKKSVLPVLAGLMLVTILLVTQTIVHNSTKNTYQELNEPDQPQLYENCSGYEFFSKCSTVSCAKNEKEQKLYEKWKELYMAVNKITEKEFSKHIEVWQLEIDEEHSFGSIYYIYKDGWLRIRSRYDIDMKDLDLTREKLLEKGLTDYMFYHSDYIIGKSIIPFKRLNSLVNKQLFGKKFVYDFCGMRDDNSGNLMLYGFAERDLSENQCYESAINLSSGKISKWESACVIE